MRTLWLLSIASLSLAMSSARAVDEDAFLGKIQAPSEQAMGQGRTALWTLPDVATQYQPQHPTPAMQAAMQAQYEGHFLDALILLNDAGKGAQLSADTQAEISLLRASFLLQGNQSRPVIENLAPLFANSKYAADAWALTAMAYQQQGKMQEALDAARHAHDTAGGMLSNLALSYALQGVGRLDEARNEMRDFNARTPQAVTLAREAELALTLGQDPAARSLIGQARERDAAQPYVIAVSGLVYLIDGQAQPARTAFETALRRDSNDAKALLGLGLTDIKLGDFQAGQEKLQAANEAEPGNALILTYLGRSQQQNGQTEAAMASWHSAEQADPRDPNPWLYQAQAELQSNHPLDARDSLREAQARVAYRSVYRGERLLREDEQLLQANLAEVQRQLGLEEIAFHTLSDFSGEQSSANLRNQADLLQGQQFGESARRSLLLQSLFNEQPGNLPTELDIYGDGAGLTGAQAPQHGAVSELGAQHASYNNYDSLFAQHTILAADVTTGGQNTRGAQVRAGVGNDTLGLGIALRQYKTDGVGLPPNLLNNPNSLDNRIGQSIVQWRPSGSTQLILSYQTFHSLHGETTSPWDPINWGAYHQIEDNSSILRLGLRQSLSDHSELRGLVSRQRTDQVDNNGYISFMLPYSNQPGLGPTLPFPQSTLYGSSDTSSVELQYRTGDASSATQVGTQLYRGPYLYGGFNYTNDVKQIYAARQQKLNPHWQLDAQLGWESMDIRDNATGANVVYLNRWLPKLGLAYAPDDVTHLRFAVWHDINGDTVGDATLAPATLAGMVTKHPGDRNSVVYGSELDADRQLGSVWLLDGRTQQYTADQPGAQNTFSRKQIDQSRLALHWQPDNHPLSAGMAYEYESVQPPSDVIAVDSVQEQRLLSQQLDLRWFVGAQCTVKLDWSHNRVFATMQSSDAGYNPILIPYQETFNQTDASLIWQSGKTASLSLGVRNAADRHFQYTSIDPLNPRFSNGRLAYAQLKLAL